MNRNKRFMAGAAALVVAAVGVAGLQGLANAYGPTANTIPGSLFLGNTPGATVTTTNNTLTDTITLSLSPSGSQNTGTVITVTLSGVNGPSTGPIGISANGQVVRATVELTGTGVNTGDVLLNNSNTAACNYPATNIPNFSPIGPWTTSGTYTATGNGTQQVRLKQIFFDDQGNKDGSITSTCAGTSNNADYYVSPVTQTAGSSSDPVNQPAGLLGLAKTAPVASTTIFEPLTIVGPNASQSGNATYQSVTGYVRAGNAGGPPNTQNVTVPLTGTVWTANLAAADFTVEYCNSAGTTCDATAITTTLATDNTGALTGSVRAPSGLTTGVRAIKITEIVSGKTSLTPIVVLAAASISLSPASGGPGTPVAVTGSNFNPTQTVTVQGAGAAFSFIPTADAAVVVAASSTGTLSTTYTVNAVTTLNITAGQGTAGAPGASNPADYEAFTVNQDRCVANFSNVTGGTCNTKQNVNVSVLEGQLNQRAYTNSTPTTGSTNSAAVSPVAGTSNVNSDPTTINLGTVTTPLAPTAITGRLNDIVVSDNRGGVFGWSLTATMPNFTSTTGGVIANSRATVTPSCAAATNLTALDYITGVAIPGFDATKNAPGTTAGTALDLSATRNLCTKSTATNVDTGSSGGVYNVGGTIVLTVPAFQLAGKYVTTMTITLA
jgi:hypothetical protein